MGTIPEEASQTGSLTAGASHAEEYEPRWNIVSWYEPAQSDSVESCRMVQNGVELSNEETTLHNTTQRYTTLHNGVFNTIIFFRRESRPQIFFAPENERILFSPGTVEMGGIGIVANRESFDRITPEVLRAMIQEVADKIV